MWLRRTTGMKVSDQRNIKVLSTKEIPIYTCNANKYFDAIFTSLMYCEVSDVSVSSGDTVLNLHDPLRFRSMIHDGNRLSTLTHDGSS